MLYEKGHGTEETRRSVLRLWVLEDAYPRDLLAAEIFDGVVKLIPEKFGEGERHIVSGLPIFDEWVYTQIDRGYILKTTPFRYQITEAGIARARYIENRFLRKLAHAS